MQPFMTSIWTWLDSVRFCWQHTESRAIFLLTLDSFALITVFATCAVVATALAQIFTNTYQKSLDCNAMQLLYHTSPYITVVRINLLIVLCALRLYRVVKTDLLVVSCGVDKSYCSIPFICFLLILHTVMMSYLQGMLIMCAFFDDLHDFAHYQYTPECVIRIAVSCVFALGVNISNYLVLGKTSPLTYQVCYLAAFLYVI